MRRRLPRRLNAPQTPHSSLGARRGATRVEARPGLVQLRGEALVLVQQPLRVGREPRQRTDKLAQLLGVDGSLEALDRGVLEHVLHQGVARRDGGEVSRSLGGGRPRVSPRPRQVLGRSSGGRRSRAADAGSSPRKKRRAGVRSRWRRRGRSLRDTSIDATRTRRSCAQRRAKASSSGSTSTSSHGACTHSSTSAAERSASGSSVLPTSRTTGPRLSSGGSSDRSVGGSEPAATERAHCITGA
mmetsp:Transcript_6235/g.20515  ORF Transcript_6235/g.20515 Transcript_6235/m.20515 type:complete len:243 (+) Transcript_6235:268-996(+)